MGVGEAKKSQRGLLWKLLSGSLSVHLRKTYAYTPHTLEIRLCIMGMNYSTIVYM
jgi:hypothetical protein